MMKVLIGGDFCPINRGETALAGNTPFLASNFQQFWQSADFRMANLECPITDSVQSIKKAGPSFKAGTAIKPGLEKMDFTALSLANNHIMDFGKEGILDTIKVLQDSGIKFFGIQAGEIPFRELILQYGEVSIGLLSYSISEYCLASDFDSYGAIGIDPMYITEELEALKTRVDHVIILLHTGIFNFEIPTLRQRELCRYLIRRGAAAVCCQHSHVCGAFEYYHGGFITYGQGSLLIDFNKRNSYWNKGYMVAVKADKSAIEFSIHGTIQFDDQPVIRMMTETENQAMFETLKKHNAIINDDKLFREELRSLIEAKKNTYYGLITLPPSRFSRALARRVSVGKLVPNPVKRIWLNLFRNEEHNEIIQEIIKSDLI